MDIRNDRPFPTRLMSVVFPRDPLVRAALIVKETYDILGDGTLSAAKQPVPVQAAPMHTAWGTIGGDIFLRKEGVDVCVLGTVRPPRAADRVLVTLRVGSFRHRLRVTGPRKWVRNWGSLVASAPEPFTEMSLDYRHAFGGTAQWRGEKALWPDNPDGLGLYLGAAHAEGNPLPNIEDANASEIDQWNARPPVAGWAPYPYNWGMSLPRCIEVEDRELKRLLPRMFNSAHPALILPNVAPGAEVAVEGLAAEVLRFTIPAIGPSVEAHIGRTTQSPAPILDAVLVWADERKVVLTYRARFQYEFARGEARHVVVL
jgi:hypothetical protein